MNGLYVRWRVQVLSVTAVLFVASVIVSGTAFTSPARAEKSVPLVKYEHKGSFDYVITQKSSYLYEDLPIETILTTPTPTPTPPPQTMPKYPVADVDRIDFTFSYKLAASAPVDRVTELVRISAGYQPFTGKPQDVELLPLTPQTGEFIVSLSLRGDNLSGAAAVTLRAEVLATIERQTPTYETFAQSFAIKNSGTVYELDRNLSLTTSASAGDLSYEQSGAFDYSVVLKPTSPFGAVVLKPPATPVQEAPQTQSVQPSQKKLRPGDAIYTRLFDSSHWTYSYALLTDKPVRTATEQVEIKLTLGEPGIWQRTFDLVPLTTKSGPFSVSFGISGADLSHYLDIYKAVQAETGATVSNNMTITAKVHAVGVTDFGTIDETFIQNLSTTLGQNTLEWKEKLNASRAGAINETETVSNSVLGVPVERMRGISGGVSAVLLIGLVFAVILSAAVKPKRVSIMEARAAQVRKKYREFLVDVNDLSGPGFNTTLTRVNSIEELVKIADSLARPILHKSSKEGHVYCVIDGAARYEYVIPPDGSGQ